MDAVEKELSSNILCIPCRQKTAFVIRDAGKAVNSQAKLMEVVGEKKPCMANMQETAYHILNVEWINYSNVFNKSISSFEERLNCSDMMDYNGMKLCTMMEEILKRMNKHLICQE
jgi:hypothetical protein